MIKLLSILAFFILIQVWFIGWISFSIWVSELLPAPEIFQHAVTAVIIIFAIWFSVRSSEYLTRSLFRWFSH